MEEGVINEMLKVRRHPSCQNVMFLPNLGPVREPALSATLFRKPPRAAPVPEPEACFCPSLVWLYLQNRRRAEKHVLHA